MTDGEARVMAYRYNSPPNWPTPPSGWTPPPGWQSDPAWGPAPDGWQFWVEDVPATGPGSPVAVSLVPASQTSESARGLAGLFGGKKRALEDENEELRAALARAGALDAVVLAQEAERARETLSETRRQLAAIQQELQVARSQIVETEQVVLLQEAGIYDYYHPLSNAVGYKEVLARVKSDTKAIVGAGNAVHASTTWQVNGSAAQGRVMVRDFSKLLLRAYNAEADNCVRTVKPHSREASIDRLTKAANTIARLGKTMDIRISEQYHNVRCYEVRVTADYLAKVEEEKERNRAERERLREEEAARRDFEREKSRLAKEQAHYAAALAKLEASGDHAGVEQLRAKLAEIGLEMEKVISREANIRAGYVYVISNFGAFGEGMVKVGMTRRLDPMDRVRELGDASVPFKFDVHAVIFSDDAVGLETRLHAALADRRVNRVNLRREFFYATPTDVRDLLIELAGTHVLEYQETAEAPEWRASVGMR